MKVHYKNFEGKEEFIENVIHIQNLDDRRMELLLEDGKEFILLIENIEGIYDSSVGKLKHDKGK